MDEMTFVKWVDQVEAQLIAYPVEPFVAAYAEPTPREAQLATAELKRRGHRVTILAVKSKTPPDGGPVYGLFNS